MERESGTCFFVCNGHTKHLFTHRDQREGPRIVLGIGPGKQLSLTFRVPTDRLATPAPVELVNDVSGELRLL